ncbi:MAG: DUF502 domain-containing protein [Planctomycetaceae bacterium]|nr:DUF502 domain-containing protein [Planctomycetaceae bacterium]
MQRQLRILLAGVVVVAPLAATAWVVWSLGAWLEGMGRTLLPKIFPGIILLPGVGAGVVIVLVYLVGLLTHFYMFNALLSRLDQLLTRVPGIKTIYESVRDLLKLFGRGSERMGRVVRWRVPGTEMTALGVLTNEKPAGAGPDGGNKVAVYLPFSYMFGGMTVFVPQDHLEAVDMPVEEALKLCATAQVSSTQAKVEEPTAIEKKIEHAKRTGEI